MKKMALPLTAVMAAIVLSSGVALAATITCQSGVDCFGTNNADTLEGTASYDKIYGRGGADTLKGVGGSFDALYGQSGGDRLFGGTGKDLLVGGAGKDALSGGSGVDQYYFGDGWGKDSITEKAALGNTIKFFNDPYTGGLVTYDLIVDLRSGAGPEARNTSGTNTINWGGNVIDVVASGDGDDRITGNAAANALHGNGGADTISGGDGDDEIWVIDSFTGDTVHCGAGEDTVVYDVDPVTLVSDVINSDCEHLEPY